MMVSDDSTQPTLFFPRAAELHFFLVQILKLSVRGCLIVSATDAELYTIFQNNDCYETNTIKVW